MEPLPKSSNWKEHRQKLQELEIQQPARHTNPEQLKNDIDRFLAEISVMISNIGKDDDS